MAWIVGVDEAGYGPNLGPLVMTGVAMRVPDKLVGENLWKVLEAGVRRHPSRDDGRVLVEDSKIVYSSTRGLTGLETQVLSIILGAADQPKTLHNLLNRFCPAQDWSRQFWYRGLRTIPTGADPAGCRERGLRFLKSCGDAGIELVFCSGWVINAARFNDITERENSKGAVLALGLAQHIRAVIATAKPDEPLHFFVDKHGGRNNYVGLLFAALDDGMVIAEEEGMNRSRYYVHGIDRTIRFTFQPRADAEHFCVALASMISKYLRELLMLEFNAFWQEHLPDLKMTAGYPVDAARFMVEIRPTMERLGIDVNTVWRKR